jgi:hypothetical protein
MKSLTAVELLTVWEQNWDQSLLQRSLALLSLVSPELEPSAIAKMNIGERDARLLQFREWMFGSRLWNMTDCPKCSERIEWETNIREVCQQPAQWDEASYLYTLEVDGYRIRFRLPNSMDLSAVNADNTEGEMTAIQTLLLCCIHEIRYHSKPCDLDDLPEMVLQALDRRMEREDPQADIRMALQCPHCAHRWEAHFDIGSYLWSEIQEWAERLLQDVHILAKTYGWSENDIVNMSPVRRQFYLDMND